jgi:hypothetical protein
MTAMKNSGGVLSLRAADSFSTVFRQIFASFCVLIAETRISLFFHVSASKSRLLLITDNALETNHTQREFDSNVHIATFEPSPASSPPRQNTNFYKRFSASPFLCVKHFIFCFC